MEYMSSKLDEPLALNCNWSPKTWLEYLAEGSTMKYCVLQRGMHSP